MCGSTSTTRTRRSGGDSTCAPTSTLAAVHQVLQAAYDWTDSHLHRFSIGGDTFDMAAEWFLCEYDVEEGEDEGTPDAAVTLDETLVSRATSCTTSTTTATTGI